jgi:hypothetical protein
LNLIFVFTKLQEVEARKAKIEEAKNKREEDKLKRQQMMAGAFGTEFSALIANNCKILVGGGPNAEKPGRNFTVVKKEGGPSAGVESGPIKRKGKTAEEIASEKSNYMSIVNRPADVANLLPNDLKAKIKQLHAKIVRLESEKYDLLKRHERQDYDLKELAERESQRARNKVNIAFNPVIIHNSRLLLWASILSSLRVVWSVRPRSTSRPNSTAKLIVDRTATNSASSRT